MSLDKEEKRRRIAKDTGDDDETVHLPQGKPHHVDCYHDDANCYTLRRTTTTEPVAREQAQQNGKAPCRVCVLENVGKNRGPSLTAKLQRLRPEDVGLEPLHDDGGDT